MNKKFLILVLAVAGLIVLGFLVFNQVSKDQNLITYKEPVLTVEARQVYEQRLTEAQKKVGEIDEGTSEEDKFNRYLQLGHAYFSLGYYQKAKEAYIKAIDIFPKDANTWKIYSSTLAVMQDNKGALSAVKKAISLDPSNPELWKWQVDLERERFGASQDRINEIYLEALSKTNNNANIIVDYAKFLEAKGDLRTALEYWQKALEASPENRESIEKEIRRLQSQLTP